MISSFSLRPHPTRWRLLLLLGLLPLLIGCSDESLLEPESTDARFDRYVALGNSITAGYQASGINQTLQQQSYAVRLADQMSTPFAVPALNDPGCPPPLTQIFPPERADSTECALRQSPIPTRLNNVAVPGAWVQDALTNDAGEGANPNALTTFILGGRTQVEVAAEASPTFATVWLGNNDVLRAALAGTPSLATPAADFETRYTQVLDSLETAGADDGALAGVTDVTLVPNLSPGAAYFAADQSGQLPDDFDVASNCAPSDAGGVGDQMRVPFRYGIQVFLQLASAGQAVELDCEDNRSLLEIFGESTLEQIDAADIASNSLLTVDETQALVDRTQDYNSFLQEEADDRGWAYVDVNTSLSALYAAGTDTPSDPSDDLVPKFPNLAPDQPSFGAFFSEDGVHPSSETHQVVTNLFVEAINAEYGTSLETIDAPDLPSE
ncbi:MAG: SGNH/GDSL hydrolase family protein [Salinibacter sp.]